MTDGTIYRSDRHFTGDHMLGESLAEIVGNSVNQFGDAPAFSMILPSGQSATMSYSKLGALSDAVAVYLRCELELKDGDVVALQSPNALAFPVVAVGVFKAGLTLTSINPLYTESEVQHQLSDSGAKVLFVMDIFGAGVATSIEKTKVSHVVRMSLVNFYPWAQQTFLRFAMRHLKKLVPDFSADITDDLSRAIKKGESHLKAGYDLAAQIAKISRDDVVLYQYTGGTTGRSKGAELTNYNVVANVSQANEHNDHDGDQKGKSILLILPLYHVYALAVGALNGLRMGLHIILVPSPRPISNLRPAFENFDINILPGINTLYLALMKEKWFTDNPPTTLELCMSGAAPLAVETAKKWLDLTGVEIHEGYGLTEGTCAVISQRIHEAPIRGTCGKALPGTELRFVDDDGVDVAHGEAGEIWVRGPQVMKGYLGNPRATEDTILDGWLKTGDVGMIDGDGWVRIVDRKKDMVIVSGFNVFPTDIEAILVSMPGIADAAITGVADPDTGERLVAWVVVSEGEDIDVAAIIAYCRESLTGYKVPKDIRFIDELPKSPVGKVLRRVLRDKTEESFDS